MTLGNLTGVLTLTWEFGANGDDSRVHSYGDYGIAVARSVNKIISNAYNDTYSNYLDYYTSVW